MKTGDTLSHCNGKECKLINRCHFPQKFSDQFQLEVSRNDYYVQQC